MRSVNPLANQAAETEQSPGAASERRLLRLAFDLHDGPLQELALLAEDLRLAARQIDGVVRETTREGSERTIRDDGRGFGVSAVGRDRVGVAGVSERVKMLSGEVKVESANEKGATRWARLPQWTPPPPPAGNCASIS